MHGYKSQQINGKVIITMRICLGYFAEETRQIGIELFWEVGDIMAWHDSRYNP